IGLSITVKISTGDDVPTREGRSVLNVATTLLVSLAVHEPDINLAVARVLPHDVALPVAIKIAGSRYSPAREGCSALDISTTLLVSLAVHEPDVDLAVARILPHDVALPVAVKIAGWHHVPTRESCAVLQISSALLVPLSVHEPNVDLAVAGI